MAKWEFGSDYIGLGCKYAVAEFKGYKIKVSKSLDGRGYYATVDFTGPNEKSVTVRYYADSLEDACNKAHANITKKLSSDIVKMGERLNKMMDSYVDNSVPMVEVPADGN